MIDKICPNCRQELGAAEKERERILRGIEALRDYWEEAKKWDEKYLKSVSRSRWLTVCHHKLDLLKNFESLVSGVKSDTAVQTTMSVIRKGRHSSVDGRNTFSKADGGLSGSLNEIKEKKEEEGGVR